MCGLWHVCYCSGLSIIIIVLGVEFRSFSCCAHLCAYYLWDGEKLRPFLRTSTLGLQREAFNRLTTHCFEAYSFYNIKYNESS